MKFVGLTRGGIDGVLAIVESDGENKYFERIALESLHKKAQTENSEDLVCLTQALAAINGIENLEDVPEFESNIPEQSSLFR